MEYLLSGIQRHLDKGFRITTDAYYQNAEHLMNNRFVNYDVTSRDTSEFSLQTFNRIIFKTAYNYFP
jgi:hypothetical protein